MLIFFSSPNAGAGVQPNHLMLTTTQQHIHTGSTVAASRRMCVYVCKMCDSSCAMSMFTQCTPIFTPFSRQQKLMNNKKKKNTVFKCTHSARLSLVRMCAHAFVYECECAQIRVLSLSDDFENTVSFCVHIAQVQPSIGSHRDHPPHSFIGAH